MGRKCVKPEYALFPSCEFPLRVDHPRILMPQWRASRLTEPYNIYPHQHYWAALFSYWGNAIHGAGLASCATTFGVFSVYPVRSLHSHRRINQNHFYLTVCAFSTLAFWTHIWPQNLKRSDIHTQAAYSIEGQKFMKFSLLLLWEIVNYLLFALIVRNYKLSV